MNGEHAEMFGRQKKKKYCDDCPKRDRCDYIYDPEPQSPGYFCRGHGTYRERRIADKREFAREVFNILVY